MNIKVRVLQVLLQLPAKMNWRVVQLGDLYPSVVLVLPRHCQILNDIVGMLGEFPVDGHGPLGIRFGHLEEMA